MREQLLLQMEVMGMWLPNGPLRNSSAMLSSSLIYLFASTLRLQPGKTPFTVDPVVIGDFINCPNRIGFRPSFEGVLSRLDLIETTQFIDKICETVFDRTAPTADDGVTSLSNISYNAIIRLGVDHSMTNLKADKAWNALPTMDILTWMGEAKKNGFP